LKVVKSRSYSHTFAVACIV